MYTWKGLAKGIYVWTRCDPAEENIKKLCQSITTASTGDSPSSASDTSDCAQKEQPEWSSTSGSRAYYEFISWRFEKHVNY